MLCRAFVRILYCQFESIGCCGTAAVYRSNRSFVSFRLRPSINFIGNFSDKYQCIATNMR
jgi:hypothetical protein